MLSVACGYETKHKALNDCLATLDIVKQNQKTDFSQLDYEKLRLYKEHEEIDKRIRYYIYKIQEMSEEQRKLLGKRKEVEALLQLDDSDLQLHIKQQQQANQEAAATSEELPF